MPILFRIKTKDIPKSYHAKRDADVKLVKEFREQAKLENDPYHMWFHPKVLDR